MGACCLAVWVLSAATKKILQMDLGKYVTR